LMVITNKVQMFDFLPKEIFQRQTRPSSRRWFWKPKKFKQKVDAKPDMSVKQKIV